MWSVASGIQQMHQYAPPDINGPYARQLSSRCPTEVLLSPDKPTATSLDSHVVRNQSTPPGTALATVSSNPSASVTSSKV